MIQNGSFVPALSWYRSPSGLSSLALSLNVLDRGREMYVVDSQRGTLVRIKALYHEPHEIQRILLTL